MFRDTDIIKLLQKIQESTVEEEVQEVPQTMKPQEEPEVETPDDMEDIEKEDLDKLDVSKKKDRKDAMKEVPDKELEIKPQESKKIVRGKGQLYLCKECCKTFESKEPICTFCESKEVELLVEGYEERGKRDGTGPFKGSAQRSIHGDKGVRKMKGEKCPKKEVEKEKGEVSFLKNVYKVKYKLNGEDEETSVLDFDEAEAEQHVLKLYPGAEILSIEKKQEEKSSEGKVPADKDSEETKIKKLTETVEELISEVPGISANDQKLLRWALKANVISNEFPDDEVMFDKLSYLSDIAGMEELKDLGAIDKADVHGYYLKYVLLPIAVKAYVRQHKASKEELGMEESLSAEQIKSLGAPKLRFDYGTHRKHEVVMRDFAITDFFKKAMVGTQLTLINAGGISAVYAKDEDLKWKPFTSEGFVEESKLKEAEDGYASIAKGLEKEDAEKLAAEKDGMVITDEEDEDKFAVIVKEE